jgi:hypothetical protein
MATKSVLDGLAGEADSEATVASEAGAEGSTFERRGAAVREARIDREGSPQTRSAPAPMACGTIAPRLCEMILAATQ